MEEPGRLQSMRSLRVGHDWATSFSLSCLVEGNGKPLRCSCLENPRDRGVWWAAVYGVAQSRTQLKWLSSNRDIVTNYLCYITFLLKKLPSQVQVDEIFFFMKFINDAIDEYESDHIYWKCEFDSCAHKMRYMLKIKLLHFQLNIDIKLKQINKNVFLVGEPNTPFIWL